jgi:hypothetical protein
MFSGKKVEDSDSDDLDSDDSEDSEDGEDSEGEARFYCILGRILILKTVTM